MDFISRLSNSTPFREFYFREKSKIRESAKFYLAKIHPIKVLSDFGVIFPKNPRKMKVLALFLDFFGKIYKMK